MMFTSSYMYLLSERYNSVPVTDQPVTAQQSRPASDHTVAAAIRSSSPIAGYHVLSLAPDRSVTLGYHVHTAAPDGFLTLGYHVHHTNSLLRKASAPAPAQDPLPSIR